MSRPPRPPARLLRHGSSTPEDQFDETSEASTSCAAEREMMSSAFAKIDLRSNHPQSPSESLESGPEIDLEKTKSLLKSCREEVGLTSRAMRNCIARSQDLKLKFDALVNESSRLMKIYGGLEKDLEKCRQTNEETMCKNGDLHAEVDILEKENEELQANLQEAERKVNVLSEEKRAWVEEKQSLQRQLHREWHLLSLDL
ncbi:uncharacterized protein [Typha latifolia]|uniref:uncharacterized protein isoform X2 n=1 Tax=Typha latifolia TaxID=4733 RepID=UPI003C2CC6B5